MVAGAIDINTDVATAGQWTQTWPWAAAQAEASPWPWAAVQGTKVCMAMAVT